MRLYILHEIGGIDLLEVLHRIVAHCVRVETLSNFFLNAVKSSTTDEKNVVGVYVDVVLVRMFTTTLGGDVYNAAF